MTNDYRPFMLVADPRIQVQPRQQIQVAAKFDTNDITLQGTALTPTIVQMPIPALPNNYDILRNTSACR